MTRVFWRGVRCAWLPREVEEGRGQTTPQSAPHSMAPQSARYEERECCGHNHEIEPRAVQAEIHHGNKEHASTRIRVTLVIVVINSSLRSRHDSESRHLQMFGTEEESVVLAAHFR